MAPQPTGVSPYGGNVLPPNPPAVKLSGNALHAGGNGGAALGGGRGVVAIGGGPAVLGANAISVKYATPEATGTFLSLSCHTYE